MRETLPEVLATGDEPRWHPRGKGVVPWTPWPDRTGMTVSSCALVDEHASKAWLTYSGCVSPGANTRSQCAVTGWR